MSRRGARIACVSLLLAALSIPCLHAQTAKQGEAPEMPKKTRFTSPMVLETVFAAADRSLWDPAKGHVPGEWFSAEEYHGLGRYECDDVSLRADFDKKKETWKPGLAMSVREGEGGMLHVKVRATAYNPKGNRDQDVSILFEVLNGDKVIASATKTSEVEEGEEENIAVSFDLPAADLTTDPMTKLRLTVKVVRG